MPNPDHREFSCPGILMRRGTLRNIVSAVLPVIELIWGVQRERRSPRGLS